MALTQGSPTYNTMSANKRITYGSFTTNGSGGDVTTGLDTVEFFTATHMSAYSASGGTVTVTTACTAGFWMAIGY
jgi:hypothetical protein